MESGFGHLEDVSMTHIGTNSYLEERVEMEGLLLMAQMLSSRHRVSFLYTDITRIHLIRFKKLILKYLNKNKEYIKITFLE